MKKFYANNQRRKSLRQEEKKRYNAYKKRECERRRRYKLQGKMNHICFCSYRCEACSCFYKKEEDIHLLFGFSVCVLCLRSLEKMFTFFTKSKFDYTPHKETLVNVSNELQCIFN